MLSLHEICVEHAMRVENVSCDAKSDVHANNVVLREFHFLCHLEGIRVGLLDSIETLAEGKGSCPIREDRVCRFRHLLLFLITILFD